MGVKREGHEMARFSNLHPSWKLSRAGHQEGGKLRYCCQYFLLSGEGMYDLLIAYA